MKILLLDCAKIKYMPYVNFYLENIDQEANEVHLLYWNRDLQDEDVSRYNRLTLHEFRRYQEDDVPKFTKIGGFRAYREYARRVIREGAFDFLVVFGSLPGILLAPLLLGQYRGRFILDYRDSSYESFPPYKHMLGRIVMASQATFVSSDAFRRFLPEKAADKIYTSHNLLMDSMNHREDRARLGVPSEKIRLAFWGIIRHEELNREIIRRLSGDSRFELHYYGREQRVALNLKQYAGELGGGNVFFHGEYTPEQRYDFVRQTDILHNLYCDSNMMLAMGNKYYDGIIFRIPQVCLPGSFMGQCVEENGVGCALNPNDENFADRLYAWYQALDQDAFRHSCDRTLERVLREYNQGVAAIARAMKD